jgi:hypothetical protein
MALEALEDGQRILPHAVHEPMTSNSDGSLGPMMPGSTQPETSIVHHAGICKVKRYAFEIS